MSRTAEKDVPAGAVARVVPSRFGNGHITLMCPREHEVITAPPDSRTGRALLAGDFTEESCGTVSCDWTGVAR